MEGETLGRAVGEEGCHVHPCICPSAFPSSRTLQRVAATGLGGGRRQTTQACRKRCHGAGVKQVQEQPPCCGQGRPPRRSHLSGCCGRARGRVRCVVLVSLQAAMAEEEKPLGPFFPLAKMNLFHFLCSWKLYSLSVL